MQDVMSPTMDRTDATQSESYDLVEDVDKGLTNVLGFAFMAGAVGLAMNNKYAKRSDQKRRIYHSLEKQTKEDNLVKSLFSATEKDPALVQNAVREREKALFKLIRLVDARFGDTIIDPTIHSSVNDYVDSLLKNPMYRKSLGALNIEGLTMTTPRGEKVNILAPLLANKTLAIPQENRTEYTNTLKRFKPDELKKTIEEEKKHGFQNHVLGYRKAFVASSQTKKEAEAAWENNNRKIIEEAFYELANSGKIDNLEHDLYIKYLDKLKTNPKYKKYFIKYGNNPEVRRLCAVYARNHNYYLSNTLFRSVSQQIEEYHKQVEAAIRQVEEIQKSAMAQTQQEEKPSSGFNMPNFSKWGEYGSKAMDFITENGGKFAESAFNGFTKLGGMFGGGGAATGVGAAGTGAAAAGAAGTAATGAAAAGAGAGAAGAAAAGTAALATSEIWVPLLIIGVVVLIIIIAIFFIAMNMTTTTSQPYALQAEKTPIVYSIQKNNTGNLSALFGELPPLSPNAFTEGEKVKTKCLPNKDTYLKSQGDTGLPWELFAAIHYIEGQCEEDRSLVSGRKSIQSTNSIPQCEPDIERFHTCNSVQQNPGDPVLGECKPDGKDEEVRQGCVFSSLEASALYSAINMKGLAGDKTPETLEDFAKMLSRRSGGGNRNCSDELPNTRTKYTGCPRLYEGEDDAYVMNWFDAKHEEMYIMYQEDGKQLDKENALLWQRPGVLTIMRLLSEE